MKQPPREILPAGVLLVVAFMGIPAAATDYPLHNPPVGCVMVVGGFWGPRLTRNATTTLTHNFDFLEKT